jgi:hypothetical protein
LVYTFSGIYPLIVTPVVASARIPSVVNPTDEVVCVVDKIIIVHKVRVASIRRNALNAQALLVVEDASKLKSWSDFALL